LAVGFAHGGGADVVRGVVEDDLRQFPRIAQPQIEALSGDRMQRLRGVADEDGVGESEVGCALQP